MKIPRFFYQELKQRCKTSSEIRKYLTLSRKGAEYIGLCPFHDEKTPSFTINDAKGFYHCFGCGSHGDVIKFISEKCRLSYKDAAIKLAETNNITIPKMSSAESKQYEETEDLYKIMDVALSYFINQLNKESIYYLNNRNITQDLIEKFEIGFSGYNQLHHYFDKHNIPLLLSAKAGLTGKSDDGSIYEVFRNRIIFPIRNIYNKVVGFGGRSIGDKMPKYLNSPEGPLFQKKKILYGENIAASASYKTNNIIVVEGYLDVISMHKMGFSQTVASLGTAITRDHLTKLFNIIDEVIICMDGDRAGIEASTKAIMNALDLLSPNNIISFIMLPNDQDPDLIAQKDGAAKIMEKLLANRVSLSEMIFNLERNNIQGNNPEKLSLLEKNLELYLDKIQDRIIKKNFSYYFKSQIWSLRNNQPHKSHAKDISITMPNINSEAKILEQDMISILINFPILLKNNNVRSFLEDKPFTDDELSGCQNYLLAIAERDDYMDSIEEKLSDSIFCHLQTRFLSNTHSFCTNDIELSWEFLFLKYQLLILQDEYYTIMMKVHQHNSEQIRAYEEEIARLSHQIHVINNQISSV